MSEPSFADHGSTGTWTTESTATTDDMLTWPHTPPKERYDRARAYLDGVSQEDAGRDGAGTQTIDDSARMASTQEASAFHLRAGRALSKMPPPADSQEKRLRQVFGISRTGRTPTTVPVIIELRRHPLPGEEAGSRGYAFTRLERNTEWSGMNALLPLLKGIDVLVVESETQRNDPGLIMAAEFDGATAENQGTQEFPAGLATVLREIALWHGARSCTWVPEWDGRDEWNDTPMPEEPPERGSGQSEDWPLPSTPVAAGFPLQNGV